ncbi:dihydrodipicolinate synthase family protein [Nocardia australiensis]|uniref:dihydrodipicolinate synthase family protein n=1 Tax=Nocardia australiensis TaxID=2887191 RepID=UPI001D1526EB|nr:dihydrodipicolinate synthase family protein [Nocardia australiensis]
MVHREPLKGIFVPLVTPFTADGDIAIDALESLANQVLDEGATGLVALGTTGEPAALDSDEKRAVLDVCAAVCRARDATLIVGAGDNNTRTTAAALHALGSRPEVAAALVPVPYYTRPSEAGVLAHFTELAATSPVPLIIYHIPYRTARSLSAHTLRHIGLLPAVVAVKYAIGGIDADTIDLLGDLPPEFTVLAGDDQFFSPLLALGATGGILATAQLTTAPFVATAAAWAAANNTVARDLGAGLARVAAAAFREPNPTVIKAVLHAQGRIPAPDVRLPLLPAAPEVVEQTMKLLAELPQAHSAHPQSTRQPPHRTWCS